MLLRMSLEALPFYGFLMGLRYLLQDTQADANCIEEQPVFVLRDFNAFHFGSGVLVIFEVCAWSRWSH